MKLKNYSLSILLAAFGASAQAQVVTTVPSPVKDASTNVAVHYHPYNDPANTGATPNSVVFESSYHDSLFVYTYLKNTKPATTADSHEVTPWGSVNTNAKLYVSRVDSNDYVWILPDVSTFYGLSGGTVADTVSVIFRNSGGTSQTENIYIPVVHSNGVANVNANGQKVSVYPNPASNNVAVSYSFATKGNTTISLVNLIGQTVMTRELGQQQAGSVNLSLAGVPSGVYMLTVVSGDDKTVQRFVKN